MKYSENGFWIKKNGDEYTIGLSDKGQDDLGDVAFIDLPQEGAIKKDDVLIDLEAAKAVTELTAPLSGTITTIHEEIADEPELLNSTKEEENWIVKMTDVDEEEYNALSDQSGLA